MIYATTNSFFTVWKGTFKDKYSEFNLSTSRKDRMSGEYKNSSWNYVRFVKDAFDKSKDLKERDRITNITFALDAEPYTDREGNTQYPKYPRMVIFDFEVATPNGGGGGHGSSSRVAPKPKSAPYAQEPVDDVDEDGGELPF